MEISGEGKALGRTIEKASEETNLVGLRPYAVELEGRCPNVGGVVGFVARGGLCLGDEIWARVRARSGEGRGRMGFTFNGELASRGFEREARGWGSGSGSGWGWG